MPTHKSSDYKLSAVKYKSSNNITRKKRDYTSYKITNHQLEKGNLKNI